MKAINESFLQNSLGSESTKRLSEYRDHLRHDSTRRLFDSKPLEVMKRYAYNPAKIDAILNYLKNLTNADGEKFCRSMGKYSDMQAQFDNFLAPEKPSFRWNRHFREAVARVGARYANAQLKMREYHSDDDIYDSVTDWSTATGWERIVSGRRKKVDVLGDILRVYSEKEAAALKSGSMQVPVICGTRTQASGAFNDDGSRTNTWKSKKRAVFMVDVFEIILESRFGAPLNEWLKSYPYTAIGKDDRWITAWVARHRNNGHPYISFDYSKYDSTIPSWLIHSAFDIVRLAFTKYDARLLKVIEEDFINKNIITADGVIHVTHGNPSGSRLTAIINGICNEIITETWLSSFGLKAEYNIMGDDNLIYLDSLGDASVELIGQYITHNFGIKVNTDKSNSGTAFVDPEYLSRNWGFSGPWRLAEEVISLIGYPERRRDYDDMASSLTPELIIYSYILGYRKTMRELMDVDRFLADAHIRPILINWTLEQREVVPYNVRLYVELNGKVKKPSRFDLLEVNAA